MLYKLTLPEKVFIIAGTAMILSVPFLKDWGFSAWLTIKTVYLLGLLILFLKK